MSYIWAPIALILTLYIVRCIGIVLVEQDSSDYDYYSPFTKFVGYMGIIGIFAWGFWGVASCGNYMVTGK